MPMLFYINASLAVLAMGLAMTLSHAIHALLWAIFSIICLAISMFALSAPLAAGLQVIVYAGAIMVLFVFAVMFLQVPAQSKNRFAFTKSQALMGLFGFGLFWAELSMVLNMAFKSPADHTQTSKEIAVALFFSHGFLVELISFVLLAGLIAAIFVGRHFMAQRGLIEE